MKKSIKGILTVGGIVLLGAIGSGAWQHLLGPLLYWLRDQTLNIITLGIADFKDDIYIKVASGFHEYASTSLLCLVLFIYIFITISLTVVIVVSSKKLKEKISKFKSDIERIKNGEKPSEDTCIDFEKDVAKVEKNAKLVQRLCYFLIGIAILISISTFTDITKIMYTNGAITHYHKMLKACSVYLDYEEIKQIESKFVQIKNKSDYSTIIAQLKDITDKNNITIEEFKIW